MARATSGSFNPLISVPSNIYLASGYFQKGAYGAAILSIFFAAIPEFGEGEAAGKTVGELRKSLLRDLPGEVKTLAVKAFRKNSLRDEMTIEQRLHAAEYYERVAQITTNSAAELGRLYNLERAKFLRGEIDHIPATADEFAKEIGLR
jgi:hypothetical protein